MNKSCEVAGIFASDENLQEAINDLGMAGFDRPKLSVLSCFARRGKLTKAMLKRRVAIADSPKTKRGINITPEEIGVAEGVIVGITILISVAFSFLLAGSIVSPQVVGHSLVGSIIGLAIGMYLIDIIDNLRKARIGQLIKRGGLVLWVSAASEKEEGLASTILKKHGAHDIHVIPSGVSL